MFQRSVFLILFLLLTNLSVNAQKAAKLFRSDSILVLNLEMPLKTVANDTKERNKHNAKISYTQADGTVVEHQLKVNVRGNSRTFKQICTFPPLRLTFNKADTKNTIFKNQKKLKLVTHCQNEKSYEEYIQKEYLVYKMYQKVSPYSFNVILAEITYIDSDNPKRANMHYGFFIEDIKDVAKRNEVSVFKDSLRNQEVANKEELDKLIMFQFMIGNHDWSISKMHNMKLVKGDQGRLPIPVPYDFDYSGLVDTPYALPPEGSNLENVKTRDFRGFCRSDGYKKTIDFYLSIQDDMLGIIENADFLTEKSRNSMTRYVSGFYKNLNDPKYVDKKINKACRVKHKHAYETD
ncbi:hypothetical protein [Lutimonas vermicola]|uniref:YARHG domain-containing protein n=1 Tax=Lutimonas vermicola TaxID=414288 RepID=A0ABU9L0J1_9FLAO